jgi:hypothetical protein
MSARPQPTRPRPPRDLLTVPWAVVAVSLVACLALAIWAVSLRADLDTAEDRVAELVEERDQLRRAATATVYDLAPTAEGPAGAGGTLYLTASGSGVLDVVNLPDPGEDAAYQVWFQPPGDGQPIPGATFDVDEDGVGFALIAADTGTFERIAVTREPAGGSATPTWPLLLAGAASGARG